MAGELRGRRPDSRVVLRIGVYFQREPHARSDERGRHAIAGPSQWIAHRLLEYLDAGADGFVVNLDHQKPGLKERVARFAEEVIPLLRTSGTPAAPDRPASEPVDRHQGSRVAGRNRRYHAQGLQQGYRPGFAADVRPKAAH
jgi:hypothetical protein